MTWHNRRGEHENNDPLSGTTALSLPESTAPLKARHPGKHGTPESTAPLKAIPNEGTLPGLRLQQISRTRSLAVFCCA